MITTATPLWNELRRLTSSVLEVADDITVVFVANRQKSLSGDSADRSTEYFTDYEANQILTGLRQSGFRTLYFEGENEFISFVLEAKRKLSKSRWNIVYNTAQSGTDPGRKSMIPAFCALHKIPTCNSDSYAVSLARHKMHVHAILQRFDIPTPKTWAFGAATGWLRGIKPPEDVLLIAKAGHESASIGLDEDSVGVLTPDFENVLRSKSAELQQQLVVQEFISGREFELPVINLQNRNEAADPISITFDGDAQLDQRVLLYDLVANDRFGFISCPAEYGGAAARMRQIASSVCEVLGLKGFARVDFRMDDTQNVWVTDVSTSPHIVMHSSYWHLFERAGWSHDELIACMIAVNAANLGWI